MRANIKKIITLYSLCLFMSSCEPINDCTIPAQSLDNISENVDTLSNAPEKLEIDGKIIESTYEMTLVTDKIPINQIFGNKMCKRILAVNLIDSKNKSGLFNEYTFQHYWLFSKEIKRLSEGNRFKYISNNNKTIDIINSAFVGTYDPILVIKIISKKTNNSYFLKSKER